ncbi:MAG: tRNA uridine-5-carboxymethylaminomethyl(34) synthesis enzyme MnmG [Candidatus Riflemargulisbacteria bacterium]
MQLSEITKEIIVYQKQYDVIVVGAGHAGCEAALASARLGAQTLLLTINLDRIAWMPCNPSIGGPAKSQLVHEIDALGGQMAINTDKTYLQIKMLNTSKGPAVQSLRAQSDKFKYHVEMKRTLEGQVALDIKEAMVRELVLDSESIAGVVTEMDACYLGKRVILCNGTFLNGKIHIGMKSMSAGRAGEFPSINLAEDLKRYFETIRLKTGTPARVDGTKIDFSKTEPQEGNDLKQRFSFTESEISGKHFPCHLVHTNQKTHKIIQANLDRSPLYQGKIDGIGPRYCPSIEDKVVRFADKDRHQSFLEPEGEDTVEVYTQGLSTSLPQDVQLSLLRSIPALENVEIMRPAYAIEYDVVRPYQLKYTLETKKIKGLYTAGQVNGTSGYEEAAAQGLIAGINAASSVLGRNELVLSRESSYIGTLVDDLINKDIREPYRMFTSRAEYRLLLRQDNADLRLTEKGYEVGLINQDRMSAFLIKKAIIENALCVLKEIEVTPNKVVVSILEKYGEKTSKKETLAGILKKPNISFDVLYEIYPSLDLDISDEAKIVIEIQIKYEEYIQRMRNALEKNQKLSEKEIPESFNYDLVKGFKKESLEKLKKIRPLNVGQAGRIDGVSPADITILVVALRKFS